MSRSTTKRGLLPETPSSATKPVSSTSTEKGALKEFNTFSSRETATVKIVALYGYPKEPLFVRKTYKSVERFARQQLDDELNKKYVREYNVLRRAVHPNIVKLYNLPKGHPSRNRSSAEPSDSPQPIYLELMDYGSLKDVCTKLGHRWPDMDKTLLCEYAKAVAVPCLLGLQYLHSHSPPTMHRDIKPENILLSRGGRVKWCDFDSCSPDIADTVQVGTLGYEAPETLQDGYTEKVDLWSMGRVLLRIVQDSTPATTMTTAAIALRLKDPDWQPRDDFHLNEIPDAPLRDLIFHLLERNPEKRLDAFQALQHPALTPNFYNGSYRGSDNLFTEAVEKFRTHGIVIGDGGAEKSELHQFFQVMKNDGNKVSKEDQSTLQDLFKQIVYSRQKSSVEFLSKFYEKWADDSFLLVSPDALRKWKHQNTEAAAPSSVPSASFSSDNSSQALPTSPPEPHATPLSPPDGNRSMEFSRHSTSDGATGQ